MNERFVSPGALHGLLIRSGQPVEASTDARLPDLEVHPTPETIVTVALGLDRCQVPAFRERYFVVIVSPDDEKPLLRHHPAFALPDSLARAQDRQPAGGRHLWGNFLLGPVRWILPRLVRHSHLLVWPEARIRRPDGFISDDELEEMPRLADWLSRHVPPGTSVGAIVLDPADLSDGRVLWEIADQVEAGFYNFHISDPQAKDVYVLHHHSKIWASVVDPAERRRLLDGLFAHGDVLEDWSASLYDWGDDPIDEGWESP